MQHIACRNSNITNLSHQNPRVEVTDNGLQAHGTYMANVYCTHTSPTYGGHFPGAPTTARLNVALTLPSLSIAPFLCAGVVPI